MAFLNDFKIGADPEFVIMDPPNLVVAQNVMRHQTDSSWGLDHGGWVLETHPEPSVSVREVVENLKVCFNDMAASTESTSKWRAGASIEAPQRNITLGGHVHIDKKAHEPNQLQAMDALTVYLEALDILPKAECATRRATRQYGMLGDIRSEHGRFEYRTLPSWLYSQRVTKLCLLGIKLGAVAPVETYDWLKKPKEASIANLKAFFDSFKGKDDDVDWFIESGILDKRLEAQPDRDLKNVWKVEPIKDTKLWKRVERLRVQRERLLQTRPPAAGIMVDGPIAQRLTVLQGRIQEIQQWMTQTIRTEEDLTWGRRRLEVLQEEVNNLNRQRGLRPEVVEPRPTFIPPADGRPIQFVRYTPAVPGTGVAPTTVDDPNRVEILNPTPNQDNLLAPQPIAALDRNVGLRGIAGIRRRRLQELTGAERTAELRRRREARRRRELAATI